MARPGRARRITLARPRVRSARPGQAEAPEERRVTPSKSRRSRGAAGRLLSRPARFLAGAHRGAPEAGRAGRACARAPHWPLEVTLIVLFITFDSLTRLLEAAASGGQLIISRPPAQERRALTSVSRGRPSARKHKDKDGPARRDPAAKTDQCHRPVGGRFGPGAIRQLASAGPSGRNQREREQCAPPTSFVCACVLVRPPGGPRCAHLSGCPDTLPQAPKHAPAGPPARVRVQSNDDISAPNAHPVFLCSVLALDLTRRPRMGPGGRGPNELMRQAAGERRAAAGEATHERAGRGIQLTRRSRVSRATGPLLVDTGHK